MRLCQVLNDPTLPKPHLFGWAVVKLTVMISPHGRQIESHEPVCGGDGIEGSPEAISKIHDGIYLAAADVIQDRFEGCDVAVNIADDCQSHPQAPR